ncbi:MAG: helix-turn-helix transcriptional regulator [Anaerolineae bacterium]|nr:helix-turn-helix transcriptional regulator [Anaerolineae bacterium]
MGSDKRLRKLRLARKKTIEHIAMDSEITYKALSDIERGITKQPSRETLYRILEALDRYASVSAEDWQTVFGAYGYKKPYPLPTEEEIEKARKQWHKDYGHITHPAYLIDFSQRLLDWNKYAPRLLGLRSDDMRLRHFQDVTIFDVTFGLSPKFIKIVNQDEYLPSLVYVIKSELQPYKNEPWYAKCVSTAQERYPDFKKLWESFHDDDFQASLAGLSLPIVLNFPESSLTFTFQLVRIDFVADERFRIVQWIPVDEITMRKCLEWAQEETNPS